MDIRAHYTSRFPPYLDLSIYLYQLLRYNSYAMQFTHLKCEIQVFTFKNTVLIFTTFNYSFRIRANLKNTRKISPRVLPLLKYMFT